MSLQYSIVLLTFQEIISYHYKIWFITSWCELQGLLAEPDHSHHCDRSAKGWTKKFCDIPSEHDRSKKSPLCLTLWRNLLLQLFLELNCCEDFKYRTLYEKRKPPFAHLGFLRCLFLCIHRIYSVVSQWNWDFRLLSPRTTIFIFHLLPLCCSLSA